MRSLARGQTAACAFAYNAMLYFCGLNYTPMPISRYNVGIWQWLLAWLLALPLFMKGQEISVKKYGFENGLSHRNLRCIQQDSFGFLWIGNDKGLNRYDGHEFLLWHKANPATALPEAPLQQICPLSHSHWLLRYDTQLLAFNPLTSRVQPVPFAKGDSLPEGRYKLKALNLDGHNLWLMASNLADSTAWLYHARAGAPLRKIAVLPLEDADRPMAAFNNRLYLAGKNNLITVIGTNAGHALSFQLPAPVSEPAFTTVLGFQQAADGRLWLLISNGQLGWLEAGTGHFFRHPVSDLLPSSFHPSAVLTDQDGNLWLTGIVHVGNQYPSGPCSFAQPGSALFRYHSATGQLYNYSNYLKHLLEFTTQPRQIFEDATGGIWIATEFGLLHLLLRNQFDQYLADGSECCIDGVCSMRGMAEDDDGNIYFSYYNGIHMLRRRAQTLEPIFPQAEMPLNNPFGLLWHRGYLWLGNGQRIHIESLESQTVVKNPKAAEGVLLLDSDGDIWFGCGNELLIFAEGNPQKMRPFVDTLQLPTALRKAAVSFLFQSRSGSIWVGTAAHGVFEVRKNGLLLRHLSTTSTPPLPHNRILGIAEAAGKIWLGTAGGLSAFDEAKNELTTYTTENGLANDFINSVLAQGDSAIWVGTDNGLSCLDLKTHRFANFFDSDGLSRNEFNRVSCLLASDGRMYFGGLNGVNAFYPGQLFVRKFDPSLRHVVLSKAQWFNGNDQFRHFGNTDPATGLVLTYRDKMFTAWFAVTDFSEPEKHLYSYKLEGYDKNWSEPSPANFARFFNLPPGNYTLRVKAAPVGTNWLIEELAIPLRVKEAFYKTTWFLLMMMLALVLGIYAMARYRLHKARLKALKLEELVRQRTSELATEKQKSEKLLLNILPYETAEELKATGSSKARRHENVAVLFADFKNFSRIAAQLSPEALVQEIDTCFRAFDDIVAKHGLEKIKTVGDAYLCAAGLKLGQKEPGTPREVACATIAAAAEMHRFLKNQASLRQSENLPSFVARIGIHIGPVVAGIVGSRKFAFDIWGETVNIAQRLEAACEPGRINISSEVYLLIKDVFSCTSRGKIEVKNIGQVEMYFVHVEG